jgi:cytochrome b561
MVITAHRFTPLQRLLHWVMAVCIVGMLFISVGMVFTITTKYLSLILIHKTLGFSLLVLVLIRLALRLYQGAPPLPTDLPYTMKLGAKLSHQALYGLECFGLRTIRSYGGIRIPALLPQSDGMHTLLWNAHFYLWFAFFALVLAHVAAALFHALIRRDGVFDTIAPLPLRESSTPAE